MSTGAVAAIARSPSPSYLALSQQPTTSSVNAPRKLLILDLNGTLLRRSPRNTTKERLRNVYTRPYLPSLREYLFHSSTREWLDTMIWSSAQPHSVKDMVSKCFGEDEITSERFERDPESEISRTVFTSSNLVAVWCRDTLGLTKDQYHNKTLTVKDLSKPWAELNRVAIDLSPSQSDTETSPDPSYYSGFSTVLVDDSPHKAVLQPYNHLCVREYDNKLWHESMTAKRKLELIKTGVTHIEDFETKPTGPVFRSKRLRVRDETTRQRNKTALESNATMDPSLLALVGILSELRSQTNVSRWIRSGGLWAGMQLDPVVDLGTGANEQHEPMELERAAINPMEENPDQQAKSRSLADMLAAHKSNNGASPPSSPSRPLKAPKMWYDNPLVLDYWTNRGKGALMEIGVELIDGIVPSDS